MNSLEISNLRKEYKTFTLNNVSFSIPKGYIMGFIGENGAGKTTTIKSMLNLVKRDGGDVTILGKDIDIHEMEIKSSIGYVSGELFYPKKTLNQVTNVYKRFYPNWDEALYQSYLDTFHLDPSKKIDELSKGMQLKYAISLALSHHAELLILDEPTSGLDPVARDNLLEVFQSIVENEETSILFSTHITSDLDKCADYITFIKNGSIIDSCTKDDMIDKYRFVGGTKEELQQIKDRLISYRENAFGFNGLIKTKDVATTDTCKIGQPSLDDIMIFHANEGGQL
ncbi:ABC transporter ATP-binding protein [Candidatus Xianfuyuplasma coldseepsis]|uniref:ABC transporter ATP-binding protein n=1 Tax=Candidatus Xianfuyuplasma coldseepsis TaxID=2782163 RepID=A0A7L7KSB0_9MOLU|nr:ABC transporter ATP-binding protein [Xianfuyuplasma coldseepsis]QMS85299.1 ABC transporter ATP-binding protein [Xianfuyuplasma coldseepsis]